jgi:hypothetical protein
MEELPKVSDWSLEDTISALAYCFFKEETRHLRDKSLADDFDGFALQFRVTVKPCLGDEDCRSSAVGCRAAGSELARGEA